MGLISSLKSNLQIRHFREKYISIGLIMLAVQALRFGLSRQGARALSTSANYDAVRLAPTAQEQTDSWLKTNKQVVKRPMSPHLSVYGWSIPMAMSGFYRISSVVPLSATVLLTPVIYEGLCLMNGSCDPVGAITAYSEALRSTVPGTLQIMALKSAFIVPLVFHVCNGLRHIGWDQWAYGIRHLSQVYQSGNMVLAATVIISLILCAYHA